MNIGDADTGLVLAVSLFDELFKALHREGIFPNRVDTPAVTPFGTLDATILLEAPSFEVAEDETEFYTRLHLTGRVELRNPGNPALIRNLPLDTSVRLAATLFEVAGAAPVLGLTYGGVDDPPAPPLTAAMIDDAFTSGPVADIFDRFQLDLFAPMIAAVSDQRFPDGDAPAADEWDTDILLLPADGENWACICLYLGLPSTLSDLGDAVSFMPELTELGLIFSRDLLDTVLGAAADEQVDTGIQGAELTSLELSMADTAILVDGQAERDGGVVTFQGPIRVALVRGGDVFAADTSGIVVDTDLPWWADLLLFITGPAGGALTLGLGWLLGEAIRAGAGTDLQEVSREVARIPTLVRGGIADAGEAALVALARGLQINGAFGTVRALSTTESSLTEEGHIMVLAQVFVNPFTAQITTGMFSRRLRRFVEFGLDNGRQFASTELARLVDEGMITTPGYQAVNRRSGPGLRYMRAIPDNGFSNNLQQRFGV